MSWKSWFRRPSSLLLWGLLAANVAVALEHYLSGPPERTVVPGSAPVITPQVALQAVGSPRPDIVPVGVRPPPLEASLVDMECRAWGPFEQSDQARAAAERLGLAVGDYQVGETRRPDPDEFLVYVALDGSPTHFGRVREDLAGEKIDSQQLAGQGGHAALAVGVFKTQRRAESHRARVAALGHEVHIRTLERERREYHLLGRVPVGSEAEVPAVGACNEIALLRQVL